VEVKLLPQDTELYVLAKSYDRVIKERAIRRRKLKWLWARLKEISAMELSRDELLMKLGAARAKVPAAWRLVDVDVASQGASFSYGLNRKKLKSVRRREGSTANQSMRQRSRRAMAVLYPTHRNRSGLQKSQG
jgi:hypothetical protein